MTLMRRSEKMNPRKRYRYDKIVEVILNVIVGKTDWGSRKAQIDRKYRTE